MSWVRSHEPVLKRALRSVDVKTIRVADNPREGPYRFFEYRRPGNGNCLGAEEYVTWGEFQRGGTEVQAALLWETLPGLLTTEQFQMLDHNVIQDIARLVIS